MNAFTADVRQTLAPPRDGKDGLLPPLLVALTAVTGLVDAFSYLVLGHVFVANMTGNVVFLAFALAGTGGFSIVASLVAIACFALGALAAGRLARQLGNHRELLLGVTAAVQAVLVLAAVIIAAVTAQPLAAQPLAAALRYTLIVLLAAAMGAQNATARKLAVPDLTTTVLTLTITGVAADGPLAGATGARVARRLISVAAMLLGALIGALLVIHVHIAFPLAIALVILLAVTLIAIARSRDARIAQAPV